MEGVSSAGMTPARLQKIARAFRQIGKTFAAGGELPGLFGRLADEFDMAAIDAGASGVFVPGFGFEPFRGGATEQVALPTEEPVLSVTRTGGAFIVRNPRGETLAAGGLSDVAARLNQLLVQQAMPTVPVVSPAEALRDA